MSIAGTVGVKAATGLLHLQRQQVRGIEAGINGEQTLHTSQEQSCTDNSNISASATSATTSVRLVPLMTSGASERVLLQS